MYRFDEGLRGNLVARTNNRGLASDKKTGKVIHVMALPAVNTGVPMTYMANGKQPIVLATGGTRRARVTGCSRTPIVGSRSGFRTLNLCSPLDIALRRRLTVSSSFRCLVWWRARSARWPEPGVSIAHRSRF